MEREIDLGIAKIKLKEIEEIKNIIIAKCPFCDKKIRGTKHSQIEWNLALHIKQKHRDDPEADILLKQLEEQNRAEWKKS